MMAEQQRLRTVSGGLESLSVWDDSETDRRFRRLWRKNTVNQQIKPTTKSHVDKLKNTQF